MLVTHAMSARTLSVSAVIQSLSAPQALRIDVVGPDPPPVLLPRSSNRLGPLLRRPAPPRSPSRSGSRILEPRGTLLRVIGTQVRTLRRRSPAARHAPSEDTRASSLSGWMVAAGWTCSIRVDLGSMLNASTASFNRADSLAILPFIACRGLCPWEANCRRALRGSIARG
jgi:hypothetical protein